MTAEIMATAPSQLMFDFMYHPPYGFRQLVIDFEPDRSGPMDALEMLQKRDSSEKNVKKVKKG